MHDETDSAPPFWSWESWGCSAQATAVDRRNSRRVAQWGAVWMIAFLGSLKVMEAYGDESLAISAGSFAVCVLASVPFLLAQLRFLREADELTRIIHLKAMAAGFGAATFAAIFDPFYARVVELALGSSKLVEEFGSLNPLMILMVAYTISLVVLMRRYSR